MVVYRVQGFLQIHKCNKCHFVIIIINNYNKSIKFKAADKVLLSFTKPYLLFIDVMVQMKNAYFHLKSNT